MAIVLPVLPFAEDALEPVISAKTISFHYGKHHQAYVTNANKLIEGSGLAAMELEAIIKETAKDSAQVAIFNNTAQVWNHSFYWQCIQPGGRGTPKGVLAKKIEEDFGDFTAFTEALKAAAVGQFGSGWAWLVLDNDHLKVVKTANADTPMVYGHKPLLTIDVWEHAYYLDYQNRRPDYVATVIEKLINWQFVASQLTG
jgi:Fe-Mn family superoxide dismutase